MWTNPTPRGWCRGEGHLCYIINRKKYDFDFGCSILDTICRIASINLQDLSGFMHGGMGGRLNFRGRELVYRLFFLCTFQPEKCQKTQKTQ